MDLDTQHFGEPGEVGAPGSGKPRRQDALNGADFERIEAALHDLIPQSKKARANWNPKGLKAFERTLRKVQKINKTGAFTK